MIRTILEFLLFLFNSVPFLVSLLVWSVITIALAKSIKKHYKAYYWASGLLSLTTLLSFVGMISGLKLLSFGSWPIVEEVLIEFAYATYFIHPILVIIMYMGAFSPKKIYVGRLMSIRKELSIIVGFPVIAHALKRIFLIVPMSWSHFANYSESIASPRVVSPLGTNITHFVFLLGIVMTILFLVLWITSFDRVHRALGSKKWKATQRWSYALYAMLFIHALGIDTGSLITTYAKERIASKVEDVSVAKDAPKSQSSHFMMSDQNTPKSTNTEHASSQISKSQSSKPKHGRSAGFSFAEYTLPAKSKLITNICVLFLVYGSYLFFRLKKRNQDRLRRTSKK